MGCLEDRSSVGSPAPLAGDDSTVRLIAPIENTGEGTEDATTVDADDLALCAEVANACLVVSEDPVGCIRGYVDCSVQAGLDEAHPYLGCVGGLASCLEVSEATESADLCVDAYDGCVRAYFDTMVPSEPTEPAEPGEPIEPSEPSEPTEPAEPSGSFAECETRLNACFDIIPTYEEGVGLADELSCISGFRECLAASGAYEPYVVCLDSAITCWSTNPDIELCSDVFSTCVYDAYPQPAPDEHPPEDDYEPAVCEEPTIRCYEDGGTNVECLSVYRACLVDYGVREDDLYMGCLDTLIACAGPAEASADPETALWACSDAFDLCLSAPIE